MIKHNMNKEELNKIVGRIFLVFIVIVIVVTSIQSYTASKKLKNDYLITTGRITYFGYRAGSAGSGADYVIEVNGVEYEGGFSRGKFCKNPNKANDSRLKSTYIPVVYELRNPANSKMLLTRADYKEFKVDYPEEIADFMETYFECGKKWYH